MFGDLLQPTHLIFILLIVLVIFGPKRLPEIGRGLGKGIREFKKSTQEITEQLTGEDHKPTVQKSQSEPVAAPDPKTAPEVKGSEPKAS